MESNTFFITEEQAQQRLDSILAKVYPKFSRTYFQGLIQQRLVLVNGEVVKKRTRLEVGDEVEVEFSLPPEVAIEPENIPLDILYEDGDLLAINKPAGMVVHPAIGHWTGTFVNALLYHCKELPGEGVRPGIVHRLDKETSGVLLAAKTPQAHAALVALFAARSMEKEYLAITIGNPGDQTLVTEIGRDRTNRKRMAVVEGGGKEAITDICTIGANAYFGYVRLLPQTGRTHQLRVHLKSLGTPILGDSLYGNPSLNRKWNVSRQLLHAHILTFPHPITESHIRVVAPIPDDLQSYVEKIM